jgi:hypothetical protein
MVTASERSLVLSVSAGTGCYRHIQISENATLFRLHEAILASFDFYDDHMHSFFMNNSAWDDYAEFICPGGDLEHARGFSDKVKLSKFKLGPGDRFLYIFDFGDDWRFRIRVLRRVDESTKTPLLLRSKGQISQYSYDEDEEF